MKAGKTSRRKNMGERIALLPYLLDGNRRSQTELMEYFNADRKTILAAIDALSQPGMPSPVVEEREGRYIYYRLSDDFRSPRLTLTESAVLLVAQQAIGALGQGGMQSPFARRSRSLLKKVRAALPTALLPHLEALAQVYGAATFPAKDFARHGDTIDRLVQAAIDRRTVHLRYYTLASDQTRERDYDPYAVYFDPDGATLKVIGRDHKRGTIIPLAIDHIQDLQFTSRHFERPAFDLRQHLDTYCFNGIHNDPITVRLRAYGVTARVFAERKFHRTQRKISSTPGAESRPETLTIEMCVASGRGLVRFILSWFPDIEVLAPLELRREVAQAIEQGAARNAFE